MKAGYAVALGWSAGGGTKEALYEECVGCSGPVSRVTEEKKIVKVVQEKKVCEVEKKPYVCKIHGPQDKGAYVGGRQVSGCQLCYDENRLKALRSYNSTVIRITATDKPWIMSWIDEEAKRLEVEKAEMIERILIERIPAEFIKKFYLSEGKA
jgi:RNase P/RNase MRP subunit p29